MKTEAETGWRGGFYQPRTASQPPRNRPHSASEGSNPADTLFSTFQPRQDGRHSRCLVLQSVVLGWGSPGTLRLCLQTEAQPQREVHDLAEPPLFAAATLLSTRSSPTSSVRG